MRIANFSINMNSFHEYKKVEETKESSTVIRSDGSLLGNNFNDRVSISNAAKVKYNINKFFRFSGQTEVKKIDEIDDSKQKKSSAKDILETITRSATGRNVSVKEMATLTINKDNGIDRNNLNGSSAKLQVIRSFVRHESELTKVTSEGVIRTEDNKEINFGLQLELQRNVDAKGKEINTSDISMTDPLVINFNGEPPQLSDTVFSFDINSDGKDEKIADFKSGTGYLAIDLNKDGKINNGTELFGANSGNGFFDLSSYDADSNKWIDENDEVYNKLVVFSKDKDGKDKMVSLKDAGVGAVYLGSVSSDFAMTNDVNQAQGYIRSTGLYLKENGEAQHIYQVDMADLSKKDIEKITTPEKVDQVIDQAEKAKIQELNEQQAKNNIDSLKGIKDQLMGNMYSIQQPESEKSPFESEETPQSPLQKYLEKLDKELDAMRKEFQKRIDEAKKGSQHDNKSYATAYQS